MAWRDSRWRLVGEVLRLDLDAECRRMCTARRRHPPADVRGPPRSSTTHHTAAAPADTLLLWFRLVTRWSHTNSMRAHVNVRADLHVQRLRGRAGPDRGRRDARHRRRGRRVPADRHGPHPPLPARLRRCSFCEATFKSPNVIGRLRGSRSSAQSHFFR